MAKLLKIVAGLILTLVTITGCQQIRNSGTAPIPEASPEKLRIATYNVHYIIMAQETGAWSLGDWERRKGPLNSAFKAIDADVIGFQEMESFAGRSESDVNLTLAWLLENNPDYAAAAVGPVAEFPSTQPILYRKDRLTMLDQGWFFFSETPDVIYSRTFNGSWPAFASWAVFRDTREGTVFRVINVHTEYRSRSNRLLSVALVADRMQPWVDAGENIFVIGDLNARFGAQTLETLENAGVQFAPIQGATYHLNTGLNLFGAIDHIGFLGSPRLVGEPVVLRDKFDGEWPADHYPVLADFTF